MTALSEVLVRANREGLSAREVARRAQVAGHSLNHDTAARYLRGDHGRPDEPTLIAFSEVLDVPLGRLRAAAELPSEVVEPYIPPVEAGRLTRRQRKAVDEVIRAMLEAPARTADAAVTPITGRGSRRAGGAAANSTGEPATTAPRPTRAARRGRRESDKP